MAAAKPRSECPRVTGSAADEGRRCWPRGERGRGAWEGTGLRGRDPGARRGLRPGGLSRVGIALFLATPRLWDPLSPEWKAVSEKLKAEMLSTVVPGDDNSEHCWALSYAMFVFHAGEIPSTLSGVPLPPIFNAEISSLIFHSSTCRRIWFV